MLAPEEATALIERVFQGLPDGGTSSPADRAAVDAVAGEGAATYGEIELPSVGKLMTWLRLRPDDCFMDLGSGTGKMAMFASLGSRAGRAVGVELSKERHDTAVTAWSRATEEMGNATLCPVELRNEDLAPTDLDGATVVFAGSLAFPTKLMATLARRCAQLPDLRALLSLKPLPPSASFAERSRLDVETTWADRARLYVYERA